MVLWFLNKIYFFLVNPISSFLFFGTTFDMFLVFIYRLVASGLICFIRVYILAWVILGVVPFYEYTGTITYVFDFLKFIFEEVVKSINFLTIF